MYNYVSKVLDKYRPMLCTTYCCNMVTKALITYPTIMVSVLLSHQSKYSIYSIKCLDKCMQLLLIKSWNSN